MIDFELTEEQQMMRESVGALRARRFARPRGPRTRAARFPPAWSQRRGNSGWSVARYPRSSAAAATRARP